MFRTITGILNGVPSRAFSVFLAGCTKTFFSHLMYLGIPDVEFELGASVVAKVDSGITAVGMSLIGFETWRQAEMQSSDHGNA
jgi:hypothetical protein